MSTSSIGMVKRLVPCSQQAMGARGPRDQIVEIMEVTPNPLQHRVNFFFGDPAVYGVLNVHQVVNDAIAKAGRSCVNGYGPSAGTTEARKAIARYASSRTAVYKQDDVYVTCGCSQALELSIQALCEPGENILVPNPAYHVYKVLTSALGVEARYYELQKEKNWRFDTNELESLIDEDTSAIIICNPVNPTGTTFSQSDLLAILALAEKHDLPIISDEIYGDMVFDGGEHFPLAQLSDRVPVLTCDGLTKRWLVPGWRLGWILVHDPCETLKYVRIGLSNLARLIGGASTVVQAAVPDILLNTPPEFFEDIRRFMSNSAKLFMKKLEHVKGIELVRPTAAIFFFVVLQMQHFPTFKCDTEVAKLLAKEESLFCLPGSCFGYKKGALRMVLCCSQEDIITACDRLIAFLHRHYTP